MWFYILVLLALAAGEQRRSLSTPKKITAKAITSNSIEVSWRDPDLTNRGGAKITRVYIVKYQESDDNSNGNDVFETVRSRQRRVKLLRLTPNTSYDIWVKAVKNKKTSSWSKPVKVTTLGLQDGIYMVRNLTATPVSSDAILLSWLPPEQANKVVAYTILTQLANGNGRQQKDVASDAMLEYKVGHLRPHLLYSFRVQTMQKVAPHPVSQAVLAQPFSDVPSGPPRDVTLQVDPSRLIVTWQPPSPQQRNGQLLGYTLLYKHTGSRNGDIVNVTINTDTREYILTDLSVNETYMIQIAANTINGSGPFTKWETVFVAESMDTGDVKNDYIKDGAALTESDDPTTLNKPGPDLPPKPPSEVKVVNKTRSSVFLAWTVPEANDCCPVVAYKIVIRNYNASSDYEIVRGVTHVYLPGLIPSILYGVSVTTMSMTNESRPSEELLFTTDLAEPPSIVLYQSTAAYLGGEVNLTCKGRGFEAPKIDWLISQDTRLDGNHENIIQISGSNLDIAENIRIVAGLENDSVTSSLLMYNITRAAEREYVCVAKNSLGLDKRQLYLIVNEPPRIVMSQGTTTIIGGMARLVCEASGKPVPHIVWIHSTSGVIYNETLKSGKNLVYTTSILQDSNHSRQSFLVIENSSLHDQGVYVCMVQSRAGKTEAQVILNVKVPLPGPVHKIQTIPLSPSRVSVSWLPPLNYDYNVAYYQVSYRKKRGGLPLVFNTTRVGTELYDLDHSTEYLVGVTAGTEDSLGESGPEVSVMTLSNDGLQPANVSVKSLNTSIIQLDWESPPNISPRNIRGYNVYTRREGEERTEKLFVKGSSSKQFLIGLGRDDTYYLKISTLMTWGYEAHSPWIRIQKRSQALLPPGKPSIVTAVAKLNEITLSWEPPTVAHSGLQPLQSQLKGYKILYGPVNDPLNVSRAVVETDKRVHVITGLEPSTKYMISIRAYNDFGDGEPVYTRTQTQALPPSMVQNASARPISSTEIHVQWEHPKRGQVTQYHIRYWRPGRKDKQSAWLTGNFQNYVAGSLRKNSNYRFEIIPLHGDLLGEGIVIFSYTYGDKPDGPPTNVTIRTLNSTTLVTSWSPPDPEKTNGLIIGYKLVLRSKGGSRTASFTVPGTEETYTFLNTPVSRMYKFRMAAITVNGTGVYSPWVEYTASFSSERPAPPQNLTVTETETSLTLHWEPPLFTGTAVHGYIVGYGQFIPEVYTHILSASQMIYIIKSLKPDSEYITSVRAFNHIGESPPTLRIVKTKAVSPLTTPLLAPVKLMARSESPTSLMLSWVDPVLNEIHRVLDGRAYLIRFSPLSGETYTYINTSHQQYRLSDLEPATKYEVSVKVVRGSNSSSWSLPVVNSTQQIAPSTAPGRIIASPLPRNPSLISLKWSEPNSPNGKIEEYIIYLTSDPSLDTKLWIVMRTDKREVKIKDILPHTTYFFKLQARNKAGHGPLSETVVYLPPTVLKPTPSVDVEDRAKHYDRDRAKDNDNKRDEPDTTNVEEGAKHDESNKDRVKHDETNRDRAKHVESNRDKVKHDESNKDRVKHDESNSDRVKHDESNRDRVKNDESNRERVKHNDRSRGRDSTASVDTTKHDDNSRGRDITASVDTAKHDDNSRDRDSTKGVIDRAKHEHTISYRNGTAGVYRAKHEENSRYRESTTSVDNTARLENTSRYRDEQDTTDVENGAKHNGSGKDKVDASGYEDGAKHNDNEKDKDDASGVEDGSDVNDGSNSVDSTADTFEIITSSVGSIINSVDGAITVTKTIDGVSSVDKVTGSASIIASNVDDNTAGTYNSAVSSHSATSTVDSFISNVDSRKYNADNIVVTPDNSNHPSSKPDDFVHDTIDDNSNQSKVENIKDNNDTNNTNMTVEYDRDYDDSSNFNNEDDINTTGKYNNVHNTEKDDIEKYHNAENTGKDIIDNTETKDITEKYENVDNKEKDDNAEKYDNFDNTEKDDNFDNTEKDDNYEKDFDNTENDDNFDNTGKDDTVYSTEKNDNTEKDYVDNIEKDGNVDNAEKDDYEYDDDDYGEI